MDNRSIDFTDNLPELTVSELSNQVKFTVESNFQRVRVKGEISRPTRASSGHLYLTLKDENAPKIACNLTCANGVGGFKVCSGYKISKFAARRQITANAEINI